MILYGQFRIGGYACMHAKKDFDDMNNASVPRDWIIRYIIYNTCTNIKSLKTSQRRLVVLMLCWVFFP